MKNQSILNKVMIPVLASLFTITSCSQQSQNDAGGGPSPSAATGDGAKQKGSSTGTIGNGGASKVNSSGNKGDRSNFNYLPGGRAPNGANPNSGDSDITLAGLKDPNNLLSQRIIYFDYDKSAIRPEYLVLINTHARLAAKYPHIKMRLEGHADERGSREYNVALSAARAQSVKQIMGVQGARGNQIRTIGYGEETPVVAGQGERSWQKNRRVEIKYNF